MSPIDRLEIVRSQRARPELPPAWVEESDQLHSPETKEMAYQRTKPRSIWLRIALAVPTAAIAAAPLSALAQQPYPSKVVRVVVPLPAGSPPDVVARVWADRLNKATGQ